jgi:hypothetical protein
MVFLKVEAIMSPRLSTIPEIAVGAMIPSSVVLLMPLRPMSPRLRLYREAQPRQGLLADGLVMS